MVNIFGGKRDPIVQENSVEIEHVPELEINSDIANINISIHDKKQIDIVLETFEKGPELQVNFVNEKLEIEARVLKERRIGIVVQSKPCKLKIKLPKDFAEQYTIKSSAGNIKAFDLQFNTALMKTGAGNIRLENIEAQKLDIESGAGNVKLKEIVSESLIAKSGAGNIEGDMCTGDIAAKTGSGNVRFKVDGEQNLQMTSGAGNINAFFTQPESLDATIKASAGLGNVKTDLPFLPAGEKSNKLSSVVGQGEKSFQFKTGVGNIHLLADQ